MYRVSTLFLVIVSLAVTKVDLYVTREIYGVPREGIARDLSPHNLEEEYIRHIHSMINAYRSDMLGGHLVIETDSTVDTKYRTWKRNADLINSLLALPKGMSEAGR